MFTKDKKYYTAKKWLIHILHVMLGISAVHANDYSLEIGYNEISYPYNISQTVKDAIPYPHINNLDIIASNGSVAKHGTAPSPLRLY